MASKKSGGLWDTFKTLVYAGLIALLIRTFAFEPFNIPSGSMIPTLLVGDYLFVAKYAYGYSRFSFPLGLPLFPGRIFGSLPKRGDVAVFILPKDEKTDYIKRIIGLPGDKIQMRHGHLFINGVIVPRKKIGTYMTKGPYGAPEKDTEYVETLPNGKKHKIIKEMHLGPLDNTGVYNVPKGYVFAMGDNRDDSLDSRVLSAVGYIPLENLVGRAEFIFFSHNDSAHLWQIWKWPSAIRWNRIFMSIH